MLVLGIHSLSPTRDFEDMDPRVRVGPDGARTLGEILAEQGIAEDGRTRRLVEEIVELWSRRVLSLWPAEPRGEA